MLRTIRVVFVWGLAACGGESKTLGPARFDASGGTAGAVMSGHGGTGGSTGGRSNDGGAKSTSGGAGEGGERALTSTGGGAGKRGGRGGTSSTGGMSGEVVCAEGEAGELPLVCGAIIPDVDRHYADCTALDCVSDCASSNVVPGELDGCELRCPSEAPIPVRECAQPCGANQFACGPGLYCTGGFYAEHIDCIDGNSFPNCGCSVVPESCPPAEDDRWVCARDGNTYRSACEARRARVALLGRADDEICPAPRDGLFQCGGLFCLKELESCHIEQGPNDHDFDSYWCSPAGGAGGESGAGAGGA